MKNGRDLAIAHRIKSLARKKMADGGSVSPSIDKFQASVLKAFGNKKPSEAKKPAKYAMGGEVEGESIVDLVMRKRRNIGNGGQLDTFNENDPNFLYEQNEQALEDEYDDHAETLREASQPEDSNLHSVDLLNDDNADRISKIRQRMRSRK